MSNLANWAPYLFSAATALKGGPSMPKQKAPPTTDDAAIRKSRRRSLAEQQARTGRLSTILSTRDDALGS